MEVIINGKMVNVEVDNVIHCNTEEKAKALLQGLKYSGFLWISGEPLDYTNYHVYGENTCYRININNKLTYGGLSDFRSLENTNIKVISYDDLLNPVKLSWSNSEVNELWEAIRATVCTIDDGGITAGELREFLDGIGFSRGLKENSPESFLNMYKVWRSKQISSGDIIKKKLTGEKYLVIAKQDKMIKVLTEEWETITLLINSMENYETIKRKEIEEIFS